MIRTLVMSRRKPMKRFVINHQNHACALASSDAIIRNCVASWEPKARMHVRPRTDDVKQSKIGERLPLSRRFNSVIDLTTKLRSRTMYTSSKRKPGITGGTVMQTRIVVPVRMQPKSNTSCMDAESCSSTFPRSPLNRFKIRPCGFAEKKPRCVPSTCCKAKLCKDEEAFRQAL